MPVASIPFFIELNRELETYTEINVHNNKYIEKYSYREKVLARDTQIAYFGLEHSGFEQSINLVNNPLDKDFLKKKKCSWTQLESNIYISRSRNLLFTNKAITSGNLEIPIFYGMKLPLNCSNVVARTWKRPSEDFFYSYDSSSNVLYCSHDNYWDPKTNDFRGITVDYTLEGTRYSKLFSNSELYSEATFEDIDIDTLEIPPERTVYTVTSGPLGFTYTLNGTGPFYVQEQEDKVLSLRKSMGKEYNEPWLLQVKKGSVLGPRLYTVESGESFTYFPQYPYITIKERSKVIDSKTLVVDNGSIVIEPLKNLHFELILRDQENTIVELYSTNPAKTGRNYDQWDYTPGQKTWNLLSCSADERNGIVLLENTVSLLETDTVETRYCCVEEYITYRGMNFNPLYNKDILDHMYMIYLDLENKIQWIAFKLMNVAGSRTYVCSKSSTNLYLGRSLFPWTADNPELLVLGLVTMNSMALEAPLIKDVRLKSSIDFKRHMELLESHPWLYWNKTYKSRPFEYPDKWSLSLCLDQDKLLELRPAEIKKAYEEYLIAGSAVLRQDQFDNLATRIKRIYSVAENILTIEYMTGPTGSIIYVYPVPKSQKTPLDTDSQFEYWPDINNTDLQLTTIDVSTLDPTMNYYFRTEFNESLGLPTKLFEVTSR